MNAIALERVADGRPFDSVLDVGGNLGTFAEAARLAWPAAKVTSFEPIPALAEMQRLRAAGRWWVEEIAISDRAGERELYWCQNQHEASTLQEPGSARLLRFGIRDRFQTITVRTHPLDYYASGAVGRLLLKIDVEGHELQVIAGAGQMLSLVDTCVIEVQNDPAIFLGSASPQRISRELGRHGLVFSGLAGTCLAPDGDVLQYDAIYRRLA